MIIAVAFFLQPIIGGTVNYVWFIFNLGSLVKNLFRFLSCGKNIFATLQNTADTQLAINRKRNAILERLLMPLYSI